MTDEIRGAKREQDAFEPYHDGKCRGPFDFVGDHLSVGFLVFLCIFLIIMAAQGLHWLTGGRVPELIEWQPKARTLPDNTDFNNGLHTPIPNLIPNNDPRRALL